MTSLRAFKKLDKETRLAVINRVIARKHRFLALTKDGVCTPNSILLVGDRPAPSAPTDPEFHYTPFGALWHSSLWVNMELHNAGIPESELTWINAYDRLAVPTDYSVLAHPWRGIIALGGWPAKWLAKAPGSPEFQQVHHPASWRRFNAGKPYPLIPVLQSFKS